MTTEILEFYFHPSLFTTKTISLLPLGYQDGLEVGEYFFAPSGFVSTFGNLAVAIHTQPMYCKVVSMEINEGVPEWLKPENIDETKHTYSDGIFEWKKGEKIITDQPYLKAEPNMHVVLEVETEKIK